MARAIPDRLDGEVRRSVDGDQARRVFLVTELSGAADARLAAATLAPGVPRLGDVHPAIPLVTVRDVSARPTDDPAVAVVEITYQADAAAAAGASAGWQIDIVQSFVTEVVTENLAGDPITTSYSYTTTTTEGTQFRDVQTTETRRHRAEVQRPTFALRFTRELPGLPALSTAFAYSGAVNADVFQGQPANRWLCGISAQSQGNSRTRFTYEFTYSADGWQPRFTYTGTDGLIPEGVTKTNGQATEQVYPRRQFSALGLPRL